MHLLTCVTFYQVVKCMHMYVCMYSIAIYVACTYSYNYNIEHIRLSFSYQKVAK